MVCLYLFGFDYVDAAGVVGSAIGGDIAPINMGLANHALNVV
jgi:hypothetical protein